MHYYQVTIRDSEHDHGMVVLVIRATSLMMCGITAEALLAERRPELLDGRPIRCVELRVKHGVVYSNDEHFRTR